MNKPVYSGLSILEISKTVMYEFWYDFIKPKFKTMRSYVIWKQIAFQYIFRLKTIYKDIADNVE